MKELLTLGLVISNLVVHLSVPPERMFKAFNLDTDNFMPKVFPSFKSFYRIAGDGGVGTIKLVTFVEGDQVMSSKQRVDEVDKKNFVYRYTVLCGDAAIEDIEYFNNTVRFVPGPKGGSIYRYKSAFHTRGNNHTSINEKIQKRHASSILIIRAVEDYLIKHPDEYN